MICVCVFCVNKIPWRYLENHENQMILHLSGRIIRICNSGLWTNWISQFLFEQTHIYSCLLTESYVTVEYGSTCNVKDNWINWSKKRSQNKEGRISWSEVKVQIWPHREMNDPCTLKMKLIRDLRIMWLLILQIQASGPRQLLNLFEKLLLSKQRNETKANKIQRWW